MSNYVKATSFTAKDSLPAGNANKIVKGSEIDAEFTAIAAAIATKADSSASLPVSFRNKVRNGNFLVNQRGVSGTVTLSAGAYGHDGWKAGASGCTYTFATNGNAVILTITAGSLIQPIEASLIEGGVYGLSHQGTAQARIGVNGAAASGAYAAASSAAPLLTATATANLQVNVEFSTGTVDRVQLELGTTATTFEARPLAVENLICSRYMVPLANNYMYGQQYSTTGFTVAMQLPVTMRAAGTVLSGGFTGVSVVGTGSATGLGGFTVATITANYIRIGGTVTAIGSGSQPVEAILGGYISAEL